MRDADIAMCSWYFTGAAQLLKEIQRLCRYHATKCMVRCSGLPSFLFRPQTYLNGCVFFFVGSGCSLAKCRTDAVENRHANNGTDHRRNRNSFHRSFGRRRQETVDQQSHRSGQRCHDEDSARRGWCSL